MPALLEAQQQRKREIGACSNEGWESEGLHLFQAAAEGLGLFCFVFETKVG